MLRGIPPIMSPELLDVIMRMGHGDEIVLADANFPSDANAAHAVIKQPVCMTGVGTVEVMEAILQLFPLDEAVEQPMVYMGAPAELGTQPIHVRMREALENAGYGEEKMLALPRFEFYDRARKAYAIVRTSERARFGNILLKKGVVKAE